MSFDVYLLAFTDQRSSGVPRSAVHAAFGDGVRWDDDMSGWTRYGPEDGCNIQLSALKADPNLISCISINRPVAAPQLWTSVYELMRLGNFALLFPGGRGPLVADATV